MKNKKKVVIITAVVLAVLITALLLIRPISKMLSRVNTEEIPEGYATYNASRYFFRFEYPKEWVVNTDAAGFGFMSDSDSGLVAKLVPAKYVSVSGTEAPAETAGQTDAAEENGITVTDPSASVRFYYRNFEEKPLSLDEAFLVYSEELRSGTLFGDGADSVYVLGEKTSYTGDHETFYRIEYTCERSLAGETQEDTDEEDPVTQKTAYRGELYVAVRSMAYYAVVFEYEAEKSGLPVVPYAAEFDVIIKSFRFSVFED